MPSLCSFKEKDFEKIKKEDISRYCQFLRRNGVYLNIRRFLKVAKTLADIIENEILWPQDDPERPFQLHQQMKAPTLQAQNQDSDHSARQSDQPQNYHRENHTPASSSQNPAFQNLPSSFPLIHIIQNQVVSQITS